jgi:hypothetical protein
VSAIGCQHGSSLSSDLAAVVRGLASILVSLPLVAGCGQGGSSSASNVKAESDARDQARAERITLQSSDFPIGWSVEAKADQRRFVPIRDCVKLRGNDLRPTGTSDSTVIEGDKSERSAFDSTVVVSAVAIYADKERARIAFERLQRRPARARLSECFKARADNHFTDISSERLPTPRLIDEAAARQVGNELAGPSLTDGAVGFKVSMTLVDSSAPAWGDVTVLWKGRAITVLTFYHAYFEWDEYEEHSLTNTVARRMAFDTGPRGSTATQAPRVFPIISCGSLVAASVYEISARRVSCIRARRIVRQWLVQCEQAGRDPCLTTSRFYCRTLDASYRYNDMECIYQIDLRKLLLSQRTVRFRIEG